LGKNSSRTADEKAGQYKKRNSNGPTTEKVAVLQDLHDMTRLSKGDRDFTLKAPQKSIEMGHKAFKSGRFVTQKPGLFLRETAISLLSTHSLADATAQFPMLRSTHCTAASSALTELRSGQKTKSPSCDLFLSQKDVA